MTKGGRGTGWGAGGCRAADTAGRAGSVLIGGWGLPGLGGTVLAQPSTWLPSGSKDQIPSLNPLAGKLPQAPCCLRLKPFFRLGVPSAGEDTFRGLKTGPRGWRGWGGKKFLLCKAQICRQHRHRHVRICDMKISGAGKSGLKRLLGVGGNNEVEG